MIIVQINSGLGNQMFQYAFGKALEKHYNCKVYFDVNSDFNAPDYRKLELYPFNLKVQKANLFFLIRFRPINEYFINLKSYGYFERVLIRFVRKYLNTFSFRFFKLISFSKIIIEKDLCVFQAEYFETKITSTYFKGYFHNELFFKSVENEIRNSFRLKNDYLSNSNIAISIKNSNSVSIHIRRGDYLNHSIFSLLSFDYYAKAIEQIKHKVNNVRFYVFSDDINLAKEGFNCFNDDFVFVEDKFSNNACDDLLLMSYCKHNIIANSTYSWWGAWLNENPDKIVIAPLNWYTDSEQNCLTQHLIPHGWMRM